MRIIFTMIVLLVSAVYMPAHAQGTPPAQPPAQVDLQQQLKAGQDYMKTPEYQKALKEAQEEMRKEDPAAAAANEKQMQMNNDSMNAAMGMSTCISEKVGQGGMDRMQAMGQEITGKLQTLCTEGKRDAAQKYAEEGNAKMMASPEFMKMKGCSDQYMAALKDSVMKKQMEEQMKKKPYGDPSYGHVCDQYGMKEVTK